MLAVVALVRLEELRELAVLVVEVTLEVTPEPQTVVVVAAVLRRKDLLAAMEGQVW
jgi:hypothetical protein